MRSDNTGLRSFNAQGVNECFLRGVEEISSRSEVVQYCKTNARLKLKNARLIHYCETPVTMGNDTDRRKGQQCYS